MDNSIVISSEFSPPSSPSSSGPVNRVSDLCRKSPLPSSPLRDSGFSPDNCLPEIAILNEDSSAEESQNETPPKNVKFGGLSGRYNFHFISDSDDDDQGFPEGSDGLDFREPEPDRPRLLLDKEAKPGKKTVLSKAERKTLKELKAKDKAEKAELLKKYRQIKPGECLKYVTVNVDLNLLEIDMCSKAIDSIKEEGAVRCEVTKQKEPYSVTWSRKLPGSDQEFKENFILFIWSSERLITSVKYCTLLDTFKTLKQADPDLNISLVIYGLGNYYRKLKKTQRTERSPGSLEPERKGRKKNKSEDLPVSRSQIEMALAELEVILRISNRIIEKNEDFSIFLHQFTKAISEIPYRKEIEKRDNEMSWFARGDSRDCVRIDKDFNGLSRLWLQQLCQFNMTNIDAAKAIAEAYPTPLCLYEAYDEKSSQKEKESLLQNIQIKRSCGSQGVCRRIGPELSKKLCLMFTQNDGDIMLSKE